MATGMRWIGQHGSHHGSTGFTLFHFPVSRQPSAMALAGGISVPHNHLDAIYFQMVCVSCDEHYNLGSRRPKILGCGHTFSLDCLQNQLVRQGKIECQVCSRPSVKCGPGCSWHLLDA